MTDFSFVKKKIDQMRKSLKSIVAYAMLHDVEVACENSAPHLFGAWASDLIELIKDFPEEYLGICFDTGHANIIGDPAEYMKDLGKRMTTLHVSDNDGSYLSHLPPGEGGINWDKFACVLKEAEFEGVFMLEVLGGRRFDDPLKILDKTYDMANEIINTCQKCISAEEG